MESFESLKALIKELVSIIGSNSGAAMAANDTLALVKSRVINLGEDVDGDEFSDGKDRTAYSDAPVPIFFYHNKPTRGNNAKKLASMKKRVGPIASYADWREENNLKTDHVNFQFTGEMWRQMSVIQQDPITYAFLSESDETNKKIRWNWLRYEGFTNPNQKELDIMSVIYHKPLDDFLKANFN